MRANSWNWGRAGLLTAVRPPTPDEEAVRDLCRARDDAREDRQRCRHRLGKLLLRRGLHYPGRNWTRGHRQWIDSLAWTPAAERAVVDDYLLAIDHTEARLLELDAHLAEIAARDPYREPVGWLRCFRGIDTLSAMFILAELHDFRRFSSARVDGVSGARAGRGLERREAPARPDHLWRGHSRGIAEEMRRDSTVVLLGEDVAEAGTPFKVLNASSRHSPAAASCPLALLLDQLQELVHLLRLLVQKFSVRSSSFTDSVQVRHAEVQGRVGTFGSST